MVGKKIGKYEAAMLIFFNRRIAMSIWRETRLEGVLETVVELEVVRLRVWNISRGSV